MRNVDHISEPDADNDKCKLLNHQMPSIEFAGGGTNTAGALLQAKVKHCMEFFFLSILLNSFSVFFYFFRIFYRKPDVIVKK